VSDSRRGLCPACVHVKIVAAGRSTFFRCRLASDGARYPKYPPQPVVACPGHEPWPTGSDADPAGDPS